MPRDLPPSSRPPVVRSVTHGNPTQPLLRMARFFLVLPPVATVRDIYAYARTLHERHAAATRGEARLLRQVTWCMLQVEQDAEDGELYRALALIASLLLAIIEDDELEVPDQFAAGGRLALETLALQLRSDREQLDLSLGAAVGLHDLAISRSADLDALEARLPADEHVARVVRQARIFIRQGEELLGKQKDRERASRQRERLAEACARTTQVLARLLAVPAATDQAVVRGNIVRRELKRIEVDALGVERIGEAEQTRRTRELLAWTEADLGETLTDENKAALAAQLKDAATSDHGDDDWLSEMA